MSSTPSSSNNNQSEQPTLVSLYDVDDLSAHHCGYCNQNGNISIGMSSELMRIEDYQTLIDRGWRRSGTYIYKPVMDKTCCPLYTIKCDAINFKLRKSQKNIIKSFNKFLYTNDSNRKKRFNDNNIINLSNEVKKKSKLTPSEAAQNSYASSSFSSNPKPMVTSNILKLNKKEERNSNQQTVADKIKEYFINNLIDLSTSDKSPNELLNIDKKLKAKHERLFKKLKKLKDKGLIGDKDSIENSLKKRKSSLKDESIESYLILDNNNKDLKNKLELRLVRSWPPSKEFQETLKEEHDVYTKYQTKIHNDSPLECNMNQFQRFLCTSPLMPLSYPTGPLNKLDNNQKIQNDLTGKIEHLGYGSFHQQYRLNGKLIAVGVIDILNNCISSVYFFYDPDYEFLNMGTYSSLREIAFTRQLNKMDSNIKWYYLGFYAHTCKKMRYKGFFHPSYLLCPEIYTWHPIEVCVELLEKTKYSRFSSAEVKKEIDEIESTDDVKIRCKFNKDTPMKVFKLKEFCEYLNPNYVPRFKHLINGYCRLFGKNFTNRVLIKF